MDSLTIIEDFSTQFIDIKAIKDYGGLTAKQFYLAKRLFLQHKIKPEMGSRAKREIIFWRICGSIACIFGIMALASFGTLLLISWRSFCLENDSTDFFSDVIHKLASGNFFLWIFVIAYVFCAYQLWVGIGQNWMAWKSGFLYDAAMRF